MLKLGQLIKKKRENAGLSQKRLGQACGVSDSEIFKIENGTRKNPNWITICEIAKVLDFHPFELLLAAGYINETDIQPSQKIRGLERLSHVELQNVQQFIDFLLARQTTDISTKEVR